MYEVIGEDDSQKYIINETVEYGESRESKIKRLEQRYLKVR